MMSPDAMPSKVDAAAGDGPAAPRIVTAAVLVIGNEILSGRTRDANLNYLAVGLTEIGIRLLEARVVPDVEARIVSAVNELRASYDHVFTTGGIGPTHDDITSECVAKAFDIPLRRNERARGSNHESPQRRGASAEASNAPPLSRANISANDWRVKDQPSRAEAKQTLPRRGSRRRRAASDAARWSVEVVVGGCCPADAAIASAAPFPNSGSSAAASPHAAATARLTSSITCRSL